MSDKSENNLPDNDGKMLDDSDEGHPEINQDNSNYMTKKSGLLYVKNELSNPIFAAVKHKTNRYGETYVLMFDIAPGETRGGHKFPYATGAMSPYDYWFVDGFQSVGTDRHKFITKSNFYCSVSSNDNGNVVLKIQPVANGIVNNLRVEFSNSSGCDTKLNVTPFWKDKSMYIAGSNSVTQD